jgi:hypothetical protein
VTRLEIDGTVVPAEQLHLYAVRFVQVPGGEPALSLYRNGLRVAKAWTLKLDVSCEASSCTAPG